MIRQRVITEEPPNTGVTVEGLTGAPLSQEQMYVRSNFAVPASPPAGFEVAIPGTEPRYLTPEDLEGFEQVTVDLVLECAGNGRSFMQPVPYGVAWALDGASPITVTGYQLADVVGALPEDVAELVFTGADGGRVHEGEVPYQFSISRDLAMSPVPILATHIGGEPLTLLHGAPVRLIVPGHYAMKSVKWLVRVEAVAEPFEGHFVEKYRYYDDPQMAEGAPVAEMVVRSVIAAPVEGATVPAGAVEIVGSAWSAGSGISAVEVSLDGGDTWQNAHLNGGETGWAPVRWSLTAWTEPGSLEIMARATDGEGSVQPVESRWNAGGFANNTVHRIKVDVAP